MKTLKLLITSLLISLFSCSEGDLNPSDSSGSNNEDPITLPTDGEIVTYSGTVSYLVSNNCLSCHGGNNPQAGLSLNSYTLMRNATENGNVLNRIRNSTNPMPMGGLMAENDIKAIEQWAEQGFQE